MIRLLIGLTLLVFCRVSNAADWWDALELQAIRNANSPQQLAARLKEVVKLKDYFFRCNEQIKENLIPYDCYLVKRAAQGISQDLAARLVPADLERMCCTAATQTRETDLKEDHLLDNSCRKIARERIHINRYKNQSQ